MKYKIKHTHFVRKKRKTKEEECIVDNLFNYQPLKRDFHHTIILEGVRGTPKNVKD